ncbi:MAG TPA: hypothetical protein VGR08_11320, partial [Thermomicrobiales bacterium]|nr:hypothetical protein [Thermomicrobiales bacterium]
MRFIADRRLERIGLPWHNTAKNPFPWMSETIDLGEEKNFLESRVTVTARAPPSAGTRKNQGRPKKEVGGG